MIREHILKTPRMGEHAQQLQREIPQVLGLGFKSFLILDWALFILIECILVEYILIECILCRMYSL